MNESVHALGCESTLVVGTIEGMVDGVAADLGFSDYTELLAAQRGDLGPGALAASTEAARIDACRALDPTKASRTTARDATRLLAAVWADTAGPGDACATLRRVMGEQVTRRLAAAVPDGGSLAAKSGGLFGRIRNEIAVVTEADGTQYAVAVLTRSHKPFKRQNEINRTISGAARAALQELHEK